MFYHLCAIAKVIYETEDGKTSAPIQTEMRLETSPNLKKEMYTDQDGMPTKEGCKCMTTTLLVGLVSNIHLAEQKGWRDRKEHLEFVIKNLTDMVNEDQAGVIQPGTMEY